jgi:hypothetical protein
VAHVSLGVRLPPRERGLLVRSRRPDASGVGRSAVHEQWLAQFFACNDGNTSGAFTLGAAQTCAGQGSSVWFPDLRRDEQFVDFDILVKF